jgi:hypothetical protein
VSLPLTLLLLLKDVLFSVSQNDIRQSHSSWRLDEYNHSAKVHSFHRHDTVRIWLSETEQIQQIIDQHHAS